MKNASVTDGPAVSLATWPATTYIPTPSVDPTPSAKTSEHVEKPTLICLIKI